MADNLDLFITVIGVSAGVIVTLFNKPNRKLGHGLIIGSLATGGLILITKSNGEALSLATGNTTADDTIKGIQDKLSSMTDELSTLSLPKLSTTMIGTH